MATDNELIELTRTILLARFLEQSISAEVKQSLQPTQQGANSLPTCYMFKVSDHRYGFPKRGSVWNPDAEVMDEVETQVYETTFQMEALVTQNPLNSAIQTSSDLANRAASLLASNRSLFDFKTAGVGILRITDVRNPYFTDDKGRNQAAPSFDFTLTHKRVILTTTPAAYPVESRIRRV